jgi:DNA-binding transcriptional ArsR family regulator
MKSLRPTLWRTCRVLANSTRLNLLRELTANGEKTVSSLALKFNLSEQLSSTHLRSLNARGLITAKPEGKWLFYSVQANPNVDHASEILNVIQDCFQRELTNDEIIHCATGFTHSRRIQIITCLGRKHMTFQELSISTQISTPALHRHLQKLISRKFVELNERKYFLKPSDNLLGELLLKLALSR